MPVSEKTKQKIDAWIKKMGRNEFGDPKDTVYAGGNPLFDERLPQGKDRYQYILSKHPELKDDAS